MSFVNHLIHSLDSERNPFLVLHDNIFRCRVGITIRLKGAFILPSSLWLALEPSLTMGSQCVLLVKWSVLVQRHIL